MRDKEGIKVTLSTEVGVGIVPGILIILEYIQTCRLYAERKNVSLGNNNSA